MLTLYGSLGSGSAAVELALVRCGLPYRVERASTWEADSAQAELAQANPLGQIPTLMLEDGSAMTESAAILIHLALSHPESRLVPHAHAARAQAIRGLVFVAANCYAAIGTIDYPERWCSDEGLDAAGAQALHERVRQGARRRLHRYWDIFADQFHTDPAAAFLGGEQPGALDFLATVVSRWSGARAHLKRTRPALLALLERVQTHPDAREVFARHWPANVRRPGASSLQP